MMTDEEKAIARALAENLGMRGGHLATDVGMVAPFLPAHRMLAHKLCVQLSVGGVTFVGEDVYDVEIIVKKRTP